MQNTIELYLQWVASRKASNTLQAYQTDLTQFSDFIQAREISILQVTAFDIDAFLKLELKPRTLARKLSSISSLYRWAKTRKLVSENPAQGIGGFRIPSFDPPILKHEEIAILRLILEQNLPLSALFEFFLSTGARVSEVCALDTQTVNMKQRKVRVRGKGDKPREVDFSVLAANKIKECLDKRKDSNPALFVNEKGRRYTPAMAYYHIRKLGKLAIGRRIWPHLFRHTFATYAMEGGLSLPEAQGILGHTRASTTTIYTHPIPVNRERYDKAVGGF